MTKLIIAMYININKTRWNLVTCLKPS